MEDCQFTMFIFVSVRFHVHREPFWNLYRSAEMLACNPKTHQFLDPSPEDIFDGNNF